MGGGQSPGSPSAQGNTIFKFIRRILIQSTVFVICLQFISNLLFPDHNADAFRVMVSPPVSAVDGVVRFFLSGLTRWDSQHFLHIAQFGYSFEHSIAFFPLYPLLVYATTSVWHTFVPSTIISLPTALMISGVVLNVVAFFGAAWALFALTKNILLSTGDNQQHSTNVALMSTIMFILNPANIFFRAIYTESLYAFLTFLGLNCLFFKRSFASSTSGLGYKPGRNLLEAAICFGLALTVRSNGLLNIGYLCYYYVAFWMKPLGRTSVANCSRGVRIRSFSFRRHVKELFSTIPILILALVASLAPFFFSQYYQYQTFCSREVSRRIAISYDLAQMAVKHGYVLPRDFQNLNWCINETESAEFGFWSSFTLPYTAVQGKYWQVGLFGYYQLRKLPLFLLASPTFILAISACIHCLTSMLLSHGDLLSKLVNPYGDLPFVLHIVVLAVVGCVFINVEVFTRMLFSSTPLPYWYCAWIVLEKPVRYGAKGDNAKYAKYAGLPLHVGLCGVVKYLWQNGSKQGKLLLMWFGLYIIGGTMAFANFLPWT